MITEFEDLGLLEKDTPEDIDKKIQEKLGLSFNMMYEKLSNYINHHIDDVMVGMINIAPYEDYEELIEDHYGMVNFLKTEVVKGENWKLDMVDSRNGSLHFRFLSTAVDDGTTFKGVVVVSFSGKILHTFCFGDA